MKRTRQSHIHSFFLLIKEFVHLVGKIFDNAIIIRSVTEINILKSVARVYTGTGIYPRSSIYRHHTFLWGVVTHAH